MNVIDKCYSDKVFCGILLAYFAVIFEIFLPDVVCVTALCLFVMCSS